VEIIRGLHNIRERHRGCVATIGNFDGVHLGHQAVLQRLVALSKESGLPSLLLTFEPYPQEYLRPDPAIARLTRFREKMMALRETGLERVLCLRFNSALAGLEPEQFIEQILVDALGVTHLVVGDDFRFGKKRRGDFAMLANFGGVHGFQVEDTKTIVVAGERVSSTRVRQVLETGDMETVESLLGRPYYLMGRVSHGDKRGRQIGFPTANIPIRRRTLPLSGVYAVTVDGAGEHALKGVANIGNRPTVDGHSLQLEAHLFDFNRDIYGQHVKVQFMRFIRAEQRFDGIDALKKQIQKDCEQAKEFFKKELH